MRFLFIVQGEGRGHLTQALSLAAMLRRHGHEITGVLVGRSPQRVLPDFFRARIGAPVVEFEAPRFAFDRSNRSVSMLRTLLGNLRPGSLARFRRSARIIREQIAAQHPDQIVNFYELLSSLTVRLYGIRIPMTGIAHQFLLGHRAYPYARNTGVEGFLLRLHARMTACGCAQLLGLSFRPMDDDTRRHIRVVPPLLRRDALSGSVSDEGFVLGYMVNNGFAAELRQWCAGHPQWSVHLFWDRFGAPQTLPAEGGLVFHRLDDAEFLDRMHRCRGYVTTAGFESVCEAMYLGKPMMLIPAHIEQRINAADAAAAGAGIVAGRFDLGRFTDYLGHRHPPVAGFREWVDSAEERFIRLLVPAPKAGPQPIPKAGPQPIPKTGPQPAARTGS
jgi:uncharacterized protein (TIGR00661 family)